ncbi:hypothetical protein BWK63_09805 [Flavobacterium covae]|uniref:Glycosyltransferase family 4 protein n=1 Tax=Flavobacterium covae TaxID=2906076 RepID=A0ABW8PFM8_9FLAO|nr:MULTISPECIES: glycosyltransferase family 4 protein [Flavobacterium]OWP80652.1 hypothetical protein BWK63_09805 [Flavobacterium covae]POR22859.1 hypothetical protein BWK57_04665 [Flavobacterium columnare]
MYKLKKIIKLFIGYYHLFCLNLKLIRVLPDVEVIFFFPYYHTGGAEKVHAAILEAIHPKKCVVFFTKASATSNMLPFFTQFACCLELNDILNKKNTRLIRMLTSCIANKINASKNITKVFGSNSDYYYEILPFISVDIKKIDLFHAFSIDDYREKIIIDSARFITTRVVINEVAKSVITNYYLRAGISSFTSHIQVISNGVAIPSKVPAKSANKIRVGFIGRWSEEKRPELFLKASQLVKQKYPETIFYMAGSGVSLRKDLVLSYGVEPLGDIRDIEVLKTLYRSTSILVLTSVYEGFPMVFMEGMSFGCIPVTTNVGGVDSHIKNGITGYLIDELEEDKIIANLVTHLCHLIKQPSLIQELSDNCRKYARVHFSIQQFNEAYQKLLN